METDNYPGNKDITIQRKTVLELEKSKDWQALKHAKHDLYAMIKAKEKWLKQK